METLNQIYGIRGEIFSEDSPRNSFMPTVALLQTGFQVLKAAPVSMELKLSMSAKVLPPSGSILIHYLHLQEF